LLLIQNEKIGEGTLPRLSGLDAVRTDLESIFLSYCNDKTRLHLKSGMITGYYVKLRLWFIRDHLGGCPRIGIFPQIKVFQKNKHRYICDMMSIIFSIITKSWGQMHSRTAS